MDHKRLHQKEMRIIPNGSGRLLIALSLILALFAPAGAGAQDVIVDPGYITGTVTTTLQDHSAYRVSVSAYGGGNSASKSVNGDTYDLTVQGADTSVPGGDFDYTVSTTAYVRPDGATSPYTRVTFKPRIFQVLANTTVVNDYAIDGAFLFDLDITGDTYNSWSIDTYANASPTAGETTNSQGSTSSSVSLDGTWHMVAVPNQQVRIYARLRINGTAWDEATQRFYNYSKRYTLGYYYYYDLAAGQIVTVPLDVEHVAPPAPPIVTYDYGNLGGDIFLGLNIDGVDYSDKLNPSGNHYVFGSTVKTNPGSYFRENLITSTYTVIPRSNFTNDGQSFTFNWPYYDGDRLNNQVTIEKDQTTFKNFTEAAGILEGTFAFTGIFKNDDLAYWNLNVFAPYRFYDPVNGWVLQKTYPGRVNSFRLNQSNSPDGRYRLFLTDGPWVSPSISARAQYNDVGYYRYSDLSINDYNYQYDGSTYDFGQPAYVTAGTATQMDRVYCTGSVVVRLRRSDGGLLSSPRVSGSANIYNQAGDREMAVSVSGWASVSNNPAPGVEVFGPAATYNLTAQATTADGSRITLTSFPFDLECNVRKEKDILGPDLQVTSPESELVTDATSVLVTGTAIDDTGMQLVTVNGVVVSQDPGYPNTVNFSYDLPLVNGENTITTVALDIEGKASSDERKVYRDPWLPTVSILSPATGSLQPKDGYVPVQVDAADQGFGYTVKIYLDNMLVSETEGPVGAAAPAGIIVDALAGPIVTGAHTIRAVVVDRAGHTATDTVTITTDLWPPTVSIAAPLAGSIFSGNETITVMTQATDRGIGFTLDTSLDGASIGEVIGPADASTPAMATFTGTVGPLAGGTHTLGATAADTGGNSVTAQRTFQVDAWAPTVSITAPPGGTILANSSTPFALQAQASDRGYGFTLEVFVDGVSIGEVSGTADDSAATEITFDGTAGPLAHGEHIISATATDVVGNTATSSVTVYADTEAPTVNISLPTNGGIYTQVVEVPVDVTATDQGNGFTLRVSLGTTLLYEGNGPVDPVAPASLNYSFSIPPLAPDNYVLSAEVTDRAGNTAEATASFTVPPNSPPTVDAGMLYTADEGIPIALTATGSDPENGLLTYAWDLDNDGTFETPGQSVSFTGTDGPHGHTVTVEVTDDGGLSAVGEASITVNNVAPTVDSGADVTVNEGDVFSGNGSFSDPGADTWTATVDYGSGPQPLSLTGMNFNLSHSYVDNGVHIVTVTVTDDDGGVNSDQVQVIVNNVTPTVNAGADATINEGGIFTGGGSFYDPGFDAWTATVDYGDGSGPQPLSLTGMNFNLSHSYADNGVHTVTVTVTDDDGGVDSDQVQVIVYNVTPTVNTGPDATINEGGIFTGGGSFYDPGFDIWTATVDYGDGSGPQPLTLTGTAFALSHTYSDSNVRTVTVTITDDDGGLGSDQVQVTVNNVAPMADFFNITGSIVEGDSATVAFSNPFDPSPADIAAGFLYSYDCESDGVFEAVDIPADSYTCAYPDNGLFSVLGRIMDQDGGATDYTAEVSVSNAAPVVGQITAPKDSVAVNIAVSASADFSDAGVLDTHTAEWAWGDGTTSAGVVTETGGSGSVTGSHAYNVPGVYTLVLTVTDKDGHTGQSAFEYVVVYDPSVGFVTGGGWIDSPAGAYPADPTLTGKANFGFVSKYKKGTTKPTGNTQFNYHAGDLKFHSTDYQWLVVAGPHAKFKGSGTINGSGDYGFMVTATDGQRNGGGGVDRLRMKIWVKSTGAIVYDNQMGDAEDSDASDAIEGGSVVIH